MIQLDAIRFRAVGLATALTLGLLLTTAAVAEPVPTTADEETATAAPAPTTADEETATAAPAPTTPDEETPEARDARSTAAEEMMMGSDGETLALEDLMQVEVTSASKRAQSLAETPAAVYVLDNEEIRRSGVQTIPEALRLVPGLAVAHIDGNTWSITSRGFSGAYANKLLVMIDGRSVYSPIFSGVYWDVQDVVLEDVERIEVVRGPGGAVWGANAVNGVINIITRSAWKTQGLMVTSSAGNIDKYSGAGRWGGTVGNDLAYRAYVKGFDRRAFDSGIPGNSDGKDEWHEVGGGFRTDWDVTSADTLTFQGDYYGGEIEDTDATNPFGPSTGNDVQGGNLLLRWSRAMDEGSELVVQAYYDRTRRDIEVYADRVQKLQTADLEIRHILPEWYRNTLQWGAGYRFTGDDIQNGLSTPSSFDPESRKTNLWSAFFQDDIDVVPGLIRLSAGSKFEHNDYTGFEYQPSLRLLATPHEHHTLWLSGSRAVRTPSRVEDDLELVLPAGPVTLVVSGNDGFDAERVWAFEAGYRSTPLPNVSIDLAGYYNLYDGVTAFTATGAAAPCPAPLVGFCLPGQLDNGMKARGWGTELVANWRPTGFLHLTAAYTWMRVNTELKSGITPLSIDDTETATPDHQVQLRSRLDLPWNFEFDSNLFWVDKIATGDGSQIDDYFRLDLRLGWQPRPGVDLSLVGQNLSSASHLEYGNEEFNISSRVPRSFYGKVTWNY